MTMLKRLTVTCAALAVFTSMSRADALLAAGANENARPEIRQFSQFVGTWKCAGSWNSAGSAAGVSNQNNSRT